MGPHTGTSFLATTLAFGSLFLCQCASMGPMVAVEGELSTPSHSLPRHEYPFDENGRYREDWVSSGGSGRRGSASRSKASSSPSSNRSTSTATPPVSATSRNASTSTPAMVAVADTSPPRQEYHTVGRGDTLWSISRRYSVSVAALKAENGMSADTIRIGETLRLP